MKPYRSSSDKENCSPISSNCVIWQGPDLSCINLCKGDSVSDVVYKLATQVCDFQNTVSLDQINLNCLLDLCGASEPDMTLVGVLQLIIDGICCTQGQAMTAASALRLSATYAENTIILPECLWYTDPATGLLVTQLPVSEYAVLTANTLCDLKSVVNLQGNAIASNTERIVALENNPGYVAPTVIPSCSHPGVTPGISTQIETLLQGLDADFCNIKTALGSSTDIVNAASQQCTLLSSASALGQSGTMSGIAGWNTTINNFAQSIQNLWLTVCDMRTAVNDLKQSILPDCTQFHLGFTGGTDSGRTNVTLTFNSLTSIPFGFANCPTLSTVSITDNDGHTYTDTLDLLTVATDPSGITYNISTAFLNTSLPYTVTVTGCIVKDGITCSKEVSIVLNPVTTTTTTPPNISYSLLIESSDLTDATGNTNPLNDGTVIVSYVPAGSGTAIIEQYTISGYQGPICVNQLYAPYIYYFKNDLPVVGASQATPVGTCSITTTTTTIFAP